MSIWNVIICISRDGDTSYNSEDFLLEIEHFNTMIYNREKQIHENSVKVRYKPKKAIGISKA